MCKEIKSNPFVSAHSKMQVKISVALLKRSERILCALLNTSSFNKRLSNHQSCVCARTNNVNSIHWKCHCIPWYIAIKNLGDFPGMIWPMRNKIPFNSMIRIHVTYSSHFWTTEARKVAFSHFGVLLAKFSFPFIFLSLLAHLKKSQSMTRLNIPSKNMK